MLPVQDSKNDEIDEYYDNTVTNTLFSDSADEMMLENDANTIGMPTEQAKLNIDKRIAKQVDAPVNTNTTKPRGKKILPPKPKTKNKVRANKKNQNEVPNTPTTKIR